MAYRRSIITRTKLFYQQQQRFSPSFSHITGRDREESPSQPISVNSAIRSRFLMSRNSARNSLLSGNVSRLARSTIPAGYGLVFHRNFSEVPSDIEVLYDGGGDLNGVMAAVGDKVVEAAPAVNEAAVSAADSGFQNLFYSSDTLVAAFQYLIDYVHCYTGYQWWAAIAATTLLIRLIQLPVFISRKKFIEKLPLPPELVMEYNKSLTSSNTKEAKDFISRFKAWASDHERLTGSNIELRLLLCGAVIVYCFNPFFLLLAILDMAKKVPSFTTGGALWFMDLATPDHSMCLPFLFALTFWIRMEVYPLIKGQGSPSNKKSHNSLWGALTFAGAVAAGFPSAIYCYGITSNLYSIAFVYVMKDPRVQKALGISLTETPPPTKK